MAMCINVLFGTLTTQVIFNAPNVGLCLLQAPLEAAIQTGVPRRTAADSIRRDANAAGVFFDPEEDLMKVLHEPLCAKKHISGQVLIATLIDAEATALLPAMEGSFRDALVWHLDRFETRTVDLCRATGVSRDVINKLIRGESRSTAAENALLIAAFYGKSLEEFIRCDEDHSPRTLASLADLLTPAEARLLEAQVRGILAQRGSR